VMFAVGTLLATAQISAHGAGRRLATAVSSTNDLIAAVADPSIGHIVLAPTMYYLTSTLSISRSITLEAANTGTVVLDGQGSTQVLGISSGTVELIGLDITGGYAFADGGGAAIYSGALVTFTNCNIYGNTAADDGGGVLINGGDVTFTNCNIYSDTAADDGGGVFIYQGTVTFTDCNIYENTAEMYAYYGWGGGVAIYNAEVTFTNCNIYENTAGSIGGGVSIYDAEVTFTDCNIYENTAGRSGFDNMYVESGSVCLFDTELAGVSVPTSSSCPSPPSPPQPPSPPPLPPPSPPHPPPPLSRLCKAYCARNGGRRLLFSNIPEDLEAGARGALSDRIFADCECP